jgi:hypothetical protein
VRPGAERLPLALLLATFAAGLLISVTDANETKVGQIATVAVFVALMPIGAGLFAWLGLWRTLRPAAG